MTSRIDSDRSPVESPLARAFLWGCLLAGLTTVAYWPALMGGFIWDDDVYLTRNALIKAADGLYRFWFTREAPDYWPATTSTLWIEWRLWGMNPLGYHATNLILHVVEALLFWRILARLRAPGAFLAALLFAVHPINVESVAWITQRKNLVAMLFFLASILSFLRTSWAQADGTQGRKPTRDGGFAWYGLSLVFFALAMLGKGSVAMQPIVMLGIVAWRRRLSSRDLALSLPFFAVAGVLTVVDIWFQRHGNGEVIRHAGILERLLGAGAVIWFYASKVCWPSNLIFVYPEWRIAVDDPICWLAPVAAIAVTVLLWRGRRGRARPVLYAWGYFCLMLVPVMGLTDTYYMKFSLVADHYAHLAVLGAAALAGSAWSRWRSLGSAVAWAPPAAAAAVVGALTLLTHFQSEPYRDVRTLYEATLRKNPGAWLVESNLALVLADSGQLAEAVSHGRRALELKPDLPEAHYNLGRVLARSGRLPDAIAQYREAIRIQPAYPETHYNLANALRASDRLEEAEAEYRAALRLKPDLADARNNLAALLAMSGRTAEAIAQFQESLRLNPDDADAHNNLGMALADGGRVEDAILEFERAVRLRPGYAQAHENLSLVLRELGRVREADLQLSEARRLAPK